MGEKKDQLNRIEKKLDRILELVENKETPFLKIDKNTFFNLIATQMDKNTIRSRRERYYQ